MYEKPEAHHPFLIYSLSPSSITKHHRSNKGKKKEAEVITILSSDDDNSNDNNANDSDGGWKNATDTDDIEDIDEDAPILSQLLEPARFTKGVGRFGDNSLIAEEVYFSTMGMEYPPTSPGGIAIICPRRIESKEHNAWRMLQYTTGKGGGGHQDGVSVPFFGGIPCRKVSRKCTGCTVSRLTLPVIANSTHTSVDPQEDFYKYSEKRETLGEDSAKNAEAFYQHLKEGYRTCKYDQQRCNGSFTLRQFSALRTNAGGWFIGCSKWARGEKGHRCIPIKSNVNIDTLRQLLDTQDIYDGEEVDLDLIDLDIADVEYCTTVKRNNGGKRERCDHPHRVGDVVTRPDLIAKVCPFE